MTQNTIRQNIHRRVKGQKQKVGVLVSVVEAETKKFYIGFSLCMKGDEFSPVMADKIAYGRAFKRERLTIPQSIIGDVDKFIARCTRYFKDHECGTEVIEPSKFKTV